jgi:hypothetical protein
MRRKTTHPYQHNGTSVYFSHTPSYPKPLMMSVCMKALGCSLCVLPLPWMFYEMFVTNIVYCYVFIKVVFCHMSQTPKPNFFDM